MWTRAKRICRLIAYIANIDSSAHSAHTRATATLKTFLRGFLLCLSFISHSTLNERLDLAWLVFVAVLVRFHYAAATAYEYGVLRQRDANGFRIAKHSTNTYCSHIRIIFPVLFCSSRQPLPPSPPFSCPSSTHLILIIFRADRIHSHTIRCGFESVGRAHAVTSVYPLFWYSEKRIYILKIWCHSCFAVDSFVVFGCCVVPLFLCRMLTECAVVNS